MRRELSHGEGSVPDLDRTDELPVLDVAAYEARSAESGDGTDLPAPARSDSTWDDVHPVAAAPSPSETLREIEEWIAAQNARDRANERALAQLRAQQADADARSHALAAELENARSALQIALGRANDAERALLDTTAAARAAEARTSTLGAEVEQARSELVSTTQRLADRDAELESARQSIATSAQAQAQREREQGELRRESNERASRIALLESDLGATRARVEETERELARRGESIATLAAASQGHAAATAALEQARRSAEARSNAYLENLQSREWQRSVWEGMWRELDAELDEARTTLARLGRERTELDGTLESLRAELHERSAMVERLEAERATQATGLRELAVRAADDERAHQTAAQELAARNAALTAEVAALDDARRQLTESLAAREADLASARSAHATLETTLRAAQAENASQAARIAELEAITVNVAQALQAQTAAAQDATARLDASGHEDAAKQARIRNLTAELNAAVQAAADRAAAAQSAESALAEHRTQLAANRERLDAFERDTDAQARRVAGLEAELAKARAQAEDADAPRRALETELERATDALARASGRVVTLEAQHHELTLELERTRGALEERELRIRRLERHATSSAQALGRIKVGIETTARAPDAASAEPAGVSASLVSLEGDAGGELPLAQRTTIGRGLENDLCLADTSISRHHALIVVSAHGSFIEDRESVNGVTVNGRRVRHARLADGDVITLGLRRFRFSTRAAANPATH